MSQILVLIGRARKSLLGLVVAVLASLAPTSAQTLPLPPGHGFTWMQVGHESFAPRQLHFDQGGTLWVVHQDTPRWLDVRAGWPGHWQQPRPPVPRPTGLTMVALGPHRAGGPPRADTILIANVRVNRSVTAGASWEGWQASGVNYALYEIPAGLPYGGRVLAGNLPALSDDRGATWTDSLYAVEDIPVSVEAFLALPDAARLPGAASGRDPAMPAGWPVGRVVAAGADAIALLSDDGGRTYRPTANGYDYGLHTKGITLIRRPDTHPLGAGPRLLVVLSGDVASSSVWSSDDAGQTWTRRANLPEPGDGPGWPAPVTVLALPEPGETDRGAGGRALVVLARGHIYQTTDGGDSWQVVGRTPGVGTNSQPIMTAALGPDGHLYVGPQIGWVWRTTEPFVVSSEGEPAPPSVRVTLSAEPNPASQVVRLSRTGSADAPVRVVVTDALGRRVAEIEIGAGTSSVDLDTSRWPAGVYVARAEASEAASVRFTIVR